MSSNGFHPSCLHSRSIDRWATKFAYLPPLLSYFLILLPFSAIFHAFMCVDAAFIAKIKKLLCFCGTVSALYFPFRLPSRPLSSQNYDTAQFFVEDVRCKPYKRKVLRHFQPLARFFHSRRFRGKLGETQWGIAVLYYAENRHSITTKPCSLDSNLYQSSYAHGLQKAEQSAREGEYMVSRPLARGWSGQ